MNDKIKDLLKEAEAHRELYAGRSQNDLLQYWAGRRDEAGHFRDRLQTILDEEVRKIVPVLPVPMEQAKIIKQALLVARSNIDADDLLTQALAILENV